MAELDLESMSCIVLDRSGIILSVSSLGEFTRELTSEFELELIVDSLIDWLESLPLAFGLVVLFKPLSGISNSCGGW